MSPFVHPTAEVEGAEVGEDSKVWHRAQLLAGASLGRECTVGKGAFLSSTAAVGDLVKIGNYATVMGARVEREVFIGPQAYLMEDAHPRDTNPDGTRRGAGQWEPRLGRRILAGDPARPGGRRGAVQRLRDEHRGRGVLPALPLRVLPARTTWSPSTPMTWPSWPTGSAARPTAPWTWCSTHCSAYLPRTALSDAAYAVAVAERAGQALA